MADLIDVLPSYDLSPWRHLTYSLEKKGISTAELISLDPVETARKCPLPLKEVRRMAAAVTEALKAELARQSMPPPARPQGQNDAGERPAKKLKLEHTESPPKAPQYVKTLDPRIDECLGGGFPAGSVCEIVGERYIVLSAFDHSADNRI